MSADVVHRLGVALCVVTGLWALARSLGAARRKRRVRRRFEALLTILADEREPAAEPVSFGRRPRLPDVARRWLPVVGALSACWVFVGGTAGVVVGLVAAFGMWRWQGGSASASASVEKFDVVRAARQLPLAADLLAACIAAGASPVMAARAVGEALEGPVGARLARGAAEIRLGGEPAEAWHALAALPGARGLARLLERAGESGVPAAVPVARVASEARAERGRAATARARRAGVLITAPVGLCFLPAFIAIGVLPVVLGLASGVLGGGGG
ncbi:type II secretion system F family protein [Streptomyces sp. NPDC057620]|uniref:Type II secretion system F family protein n=1 Tax=Streptomyces liliiviolaceus TaxID=2823109 RepID=A0A940XSM2_9ACTN|nr:type II secretion system F family protein [Streptomyces liliiviolaceus]MBQ0848178.1 type II secretion system F family protein [Streptomyces liliiviolaceus]